MNYEKRLRELETLLKVSSLINSAIEPGEIRARTIGAITTLLDVEAGSLLLADKETGELFFDVVSDEKGQALKQFRLKKGEGISGWVFENASPIIVNEVSSDPRFCRKADEKSGFVTRNIVSVPINSKGCIIGTLQGVNKKNGLFLEEDLELLSALATQVAIAVENSRLYTELKEAFYSTAEALAETIELRDKYTGGHTRRVMNYSLAIGRCMNLEDKELENLKLAAILHDIGKIGVRDVVLLKPGRLAGDEIKEMNLHAECGAGILGNIKQLRNVIPSVRGHHEKYDGRGYPDGLKSHEIPILSRIIAVADSFDAMTTDRPYRKGLSLEMACEELRQGSEIQFDPAVVAAFFDACSKGLIAAPDMSRTISESFFPRIST